MQKIIVMLFVFLLVAVTGTVNAAVWSIPGSDPNTPYWDIAENWDPVGVPTADVDAQFTGASEVECIIRTAAACKKLAVGDNGPATFTRKLRIIDGGHLVSGNGVWGTSGYNRDSMVTVEEGGILESTTRFGIGLVAVNLAGTPQTSYLNINGGDMTVDGNLQIGSVGDGTTTSDHTGIVNVFAGTLDVTGALEFRDPSVGFIDISYGPLTVNGDITALVADLADNVPANITAFGGAGTLNYDYDITNPGKTTITATHPMDPWPIWPKDPPVLTGDVALRWTNLAPVTPPVYVDVWFGTDPNKLGLNYSKVITASTTGENTTTVTVNAPLDGTYYWQVDSYIYGSPYDEPNMIEGDVWSFKATDDSPPTNVNAGVDMNTWVNEPTPLHGTYTDDGKSAVDVTWTSSDPSAVFIPSNDGGLTSNVVDPNVIVDYAAGAVTLTFEVKDQLNPPVSDDMIINVYADACEAARIGAGLADQYPLDVVVDCVIDLKDLAAMAAIWLEEYALTGPIPGP